MGGRALLRWLCLAAWVAAAAARHETHGHHRPAGRTDRASTLVDLLREQHGKDHHGQEHSPAARTKAAHDSAEAGHGHATERNAAPAGGGKGKGALTKTMGEGKPAKPQSDIGRQCSAASPPFSDGFQSKRLDSALW